MPALNYMCGCATPRLKLYSQAHYQEVRRRLTTTLCPKHQQERDGLAAAFWASERGLPPLAGGQTQLAPGELTRRRLLDACGAHLATWRRTLDLYRDAGRPVEEGERNYSAACAQHARLCREASAGWWIRRRTAEPIDLLTEGAMTETEPTAAAQPPADTRGTRERVAAQVTERGIDVQKNITGQEKAAIAAALGINVHTVAHHLGHLRKRQLRVDRREPEPVNEVPPAPYDEQGPVLSKLAGDIIAAGLDVLTVQRIRAPLARLLEVHLGIAIPIDEEAPHE